MGVNFMATKSILKQITIRDKKSCEALVSALEKASNKKSHRVEAPAPIYLNQEEIKKLKFSVDK